eukprot:Skav209547  [mRNA]  locus=scaffold2497:212388:213514:+ [translate_table: standard]
MTAFLMRNVSAKEKGSVSWLKGAVDPGGSCHRLPGDGNSFSRQKHHERVAFETSQKKKVGPGDDKGQCLSPKRSIMVNDEMMVKGLLMLVSD